ncbi:DUF4256 family protein [bacterium]|nr:DUF4256 family protein [bacterium]
MEHTIVDTLKKRFQAHPERHPNLEWSWVQERLLSESDLLQGLWALEQSGGEPDVVFFDATPSRWFYCDCSAESPAGRRSMCYDDAALASRKENKPKGSAVGLAEQWGVSLLDEAEYHQLQRFGPFDIKTSSWILTPEGVRSLGGALFGDYRFGRVFTYHNGAESYYTARGFRAKLAL